MKRLLLALLLYTCTATAVQAKEGDCMKETPCNRAAPVVVFKGNRELPIKIEVTVCHPYWEKFSVGTLPDGRKTKWWRSRLIYKKYQADLPVVSQECVTMWRYPGEQVESFTRCFNGVSTRIVTEKFIKPGVYYMRPSSKKGDK